jgi:hypothetical protein
VTPVELELARKLAAHPRFEWAAGMLATAIEDNAHSQVRFVASGEWTGALSSSDHTEWSLPLAEGGDFTYAIEYVPDLADPATQGCLWAMLDEASEDLRVMGHGSHRGVEEWTWGDRGGRCWELQTLDRTFSKGEALARALLSAWGEP